MEKKSTNKFQINLNTDEIVIGLRWPSFKWPENAYHTFHVESMLSESEIIQCGWLPRIGVHSMDWRLYSVCYPKPKALPPVRLLLAHIFFHNGKSHAALVCMSNACKWSGCEEQSHSWKCVTHSCELCDPLKWCGCCMYPWRWRSWKRTCHSLASSVFTQGRRH